MHPTAVRYSCRVDLDAPPVVVKLLVFSEGYRFFRVHWFFLHGGGIVGFLVCWGSRFDGWEGRRILPR